MSSIASSRQHYEICIGSVSDQMTTNVISNYFQQFGNITRLNFTSSTGGFIFLGYEHPSMVDRCMTSRPHVINGRSLYVKRALPIDDEHPRERYESTRELMIVIDFDENICHDKQFLIDLQNYFSRYGQMCDCEYREERNFSYIFIQFTDYDNIDCIILDKPHYYNNHLLNVMKYIQSNIDLMNIKYAKSEQSKIVSNEQIYYSYKSAKISDDAIKKEPINQKDLENEVFRLQNSLTKMGEDYEIQRRELDENCAQQLKIIQENIDEIHRIQQDLDQEYVSLLTEYETMKSENDVLNEQYLNVELENFEISSYYEQILADEKAKTIQLETAYQEKSKLKPKNDSSLSSSSKSQ